MIAALIAALAMQATGETAIAIRNDNPETWSVEYPRLIQPQVAAYRRCLAVTNRRIAGKADFETQHAADVTRCEAKRAAAIAEANAAMKGAKTALAPAKVDELFANIGHIHVARGRDLDRQFNQRMAAAAAARETYEANRPKGLVIEMRDASVVKARTDATAPSEAARSEKDG